MDKRPGDDLKLCKIHFIPQNAVNMTLYIDSTFGHHTSRSRHAWYWPIGTARTVLGFVVGVERIASSPSGRSYHIAVIPLEDVPTAEKDWHPGSNSQVLDLVHPSLFTLVYGRTRLTAGDEVPIKDAVCYCGKGGIVPVPRSEHLQFENMLPVRENDEEDSDELNLFSGRFQWLPCEVEVDEDANVRIVSYINNLHPEKHSKLYKIIESVISKAVPVWEFALTEIFKQERTAGLWAGGPRTTHGFYVSSLKTAMRSSRMDELHPRRHKALGC